ncbi:hypothetical protein DdX_11111 [Ditylenchus destructor]|uniref:Uncharacterized protein n=1 Tax=Ditylenchus destructor TaxID=166010 RepID=A0AAD4MWR7_9BILA|nr:hypothetical protein DdX_11111 [Ditylenchus destructor]
MSNDDSKVEFETQGDDQNVLNEVLMEINEISRKVPEKELTKLWTDVRNTLATIEKEQSSLPSHEALDQAIDKQTTDLTEAEQKLQYAKDEYKASHDIFRKWMQNQRAGKDEASLELMEKENKDSLKNMTKQYALLIQNKRNACREKQRLIEENCA